MKFSTCKSTHLHQIPGVAIKLNLNRAASFQQNTTSKHTEYSLYFHNIVLDIPKKSMSHPMHKILMEVHLTNV